MRPDGSALSGSASTGSTNLRRHAGCWQRWLPLPGWETRLAVPILQPVDQRSSHVGDGSCEKHPPKSPRKRTLVFCDVAESQTTKHQGKSGTVFDDCWFAVARHIQQIASAPPQSFVMQPCKPVFPLRSYHPDEVGRPGRRTVKQNRPGTLEVGDCRDPVQMGLVFSCNRPLPHGCTWVRLATDSVQSVACWVQPSLVPHQRLASVDADSEPPVRLAVRCMCGLHWSQRTHHPEKRRKIFSDCRNPTRAATDAWWWPGEHERILCSPSPFQCGIGKRFHTTSTRMGAGPCHKAVWPTPRPVHVSRFEGADTANRRDCGFGVYIGHGQQHMGHTLASEGLGLT